MSSRNVKGVLFAEYVRMIRSRKDIDWSPYLSAEDGPFLQQTIVDSEWYPFDTFERMGLGIIREIAGGDVEAARLWGRKSIDYLKDALNALTSDGEPRESLMRFQVLRRGYFDFDPVRIRAISGTHARLEIAYGASDLAEEAAFYQTLGYFERLLELSGARDIRCSIQSMAWQGAPSSILELDWSEVPPGRKVKGTLFVDYVRMIRGAKEKDFAKYLQPGDMPFLQQIIEDSEWYPFDTFERMGVGIVTEMADGDMEAVREWGRSSISELLRTHTDLVCRNDPSETLMRFQILRSSFFNFSAIELQAILESYARFRIKYDMCRLAEEAATHQTLGFVERLLELSGATDVQHHFVSKMWEGDAITILELKWS